MYLKVFVTPGSKRESVKEKDELLVITVREPATGNRANKRVREIVAARVGKTFGNVRILTGHHSHVKMISVTS
ncbi:hypothetical protein A3A36_02415 [Candidatus Kaiserbacteria bacterium RIFCSPLOWO2_01_FULL_52_12b]|uniref:Uncharacterized protein n=1 Tax=Candidatus Kaiserbacteria bacterium RIFCSPLOWO2_01_FULL_52_12b TaxID=1798509 RepID=A0A1F6EW98_9BACT|nr:MAG: hypothetical protein A3A36_02415 [Candidatus Kaiserbacteria bacterium RIFCSPLOWO2_01_FULL_52_12b]